MALTIAILLFLTMVSLALAIHCAAVERTRAVEEALSRLSAPARARALLAASQDAGAVGRGRESRRFQHLIARVDLLQWLQSAILQAGLKMRLSELLALILILFSLGVAAVLVAWRDPLLAAGVGLALGATPLFYIKLLQRQRLAQFELQFPEALDLIKSSLQAGHSLMRGLQVLVEQFQDPIGSEMRLVIEQTRLGIPLPQAFAELLGRVPDDGLRFLVVAIRIQAEVGSSLAEVIGRLAETVRTRQRIKLQIKALTAQPRMSGMIVGLLPALMLAIFSIIQPSYSAIMFRDPTGFKILKFACAMDLTAFLLIRRLLRTDF